MFQRLILVLLCILLSASNSYAVWIWTPESNKWTNPKYAVRETPAEQLKYALTFLESKEYPEAIRELQKLIKHYPKAREAADAQFYIGKIHHEQGKLFEAFKSYQLAIDKYPFSERSAEIIQLQYDIGERMLKGEGEKGIMGSIIGATDKVVEVFEAVIKNSPYSDLAPSAQYKIGLYLLENKLYQEARDEFMKVVNDYSESEWAKSAEYQIAVTDSKRSVDAAYDQEITQTAVEGFEDYIKKNPDAALSVEAKTQIQALREKEAKNAFLVAQYYQKQKKFKAAKIYFQAVVDDYQDTTWARKALEKIREVGAKE